MKVIDRKKPLTHFRYRCYSCRSDMVMEWLETAHNKYGDERVTHCPVCGFATSLDPDKYTECDEDGNV